MPLACYYHYETGNMPLACFTAGRQEGCLSHPITTMRQEICLSLAITAGRHKGCPSLAILPLGDRKDAPRLLYYRWETGRMPLACFTAGRQFRMSNYGTKVVTIFGWMVEFWVSPFTLIYFRLATILNLIIAINISRLLCRALQPYK